MPGADLVTGAFALSVFMAGAALAVLAVLGVYAFRHAGQAGTTGALWRGGLVLVGAIVAWVLLDRSSVREVAAERRSIETRAAELTARAIAPGSPLACLDAVASAAVENACERSLFATPEAVAAAVAYVDARFSLLAASIALAERDPGAQPALERLRRGIEADRFGFVAHVLATRGCNAADCRDFKLLRDTGRIIANMKSRTFEVQVGMHVAAWQSNSAVAATPAPPPVAALPPPPTDNAVAAVSAAPSMPVPPTAMQAAPGAPVASAPPKFDYPSADSIPAVSIMSAEPAAPPGAEQPRAAAPPQPKRAPAPPPRRQSAREPAPPPMPVAPQVTPQTSGAR